MLVTLRKLLSQVDQELRTEEPFVMLSGTSAPRSFALTGEGLVRANERAFAGS